MGIEARLGLQGSALLTLLRHFIWDLLYLLREDKSQFGEQGLVKEHMWSDYKANPRGFFLELGGNQPVKCSKTYVFSRLRIGGGTSIDANPSFAPLWKLFRKRDLFLSFAVVPGSHPSSTVTFYDFEPRLNLVSSIDLAHAEAWKVASRGEFAVREVAAVKLSQAVQMHFDHWGCRPTALFLDIEGMDKKKLESYLFFWTVQDLSGS